MFRKLISWQNIGRTDFQNSKENCREKAVKSRKFEMLSEGKKRKNTYKENKKVEGSHAAKKIIRKQLMNNNFYIEENKLNFE